MTTTITQLMVIFIDFNSSFPCMKADYITEQTFGVDLEARARADRKRVPIIVTTILTFLDNRRHMPQNSYRI